MRKTVYLPFELTVKRRGHVIMHVKKNVKSPVSDVGKNAVKKMFPFEPYTKDGIPQYVECGTVMEYRGAGENGAVWSCSKGHGQTEE